MRDPEGELIRMHPGIAGVGDLDPAVYGWEERVAKITIKRVSRPARPHEPQDDNR